MSDYIRCCELIDFLADYLSGELSAPMRREFERHLAVCPPCINYLKTYEQTIRLSKAAGGDTPDEPVEPLPEQLVQAILAARAKRS